jgi:hypothetical protein
VASFGDPLNSPLPYAPNLKIFCLYGVGKSTERAYHYVHRPGQSDRPFALDVAHHGGGAERGVTSVVGLSLSLHSRVSDWFTWYVDYNGCHQSNRVLTAK